MKGSCDIGVSIEESLGAPKIPIKSAKIHASSEGLWSGKGSDRVVLIIFRFNASRGFMISQEAFQKKPSNRVACKGTG